MSTNVQTVTNGAVTPGIGHNQKAIEEANLQTWLDACRQFGEAAGAGDTSKIGWFQDMVQRSYRGEIAMTMAEKGYDAFVEARAKRATMLGKRAPSGKGADRGVRISEAKKMIQLGGLQQIHGTNNGGLGVFNAALKIIGQDVAVKGELDKLMLKVAREQCRRPDTPMDEQYIKQTLRPKEAPDVNEGDAVFSAKKNVDKIGNEFGWSPELRSASSNLGARLEKLNYKTAADRKAEEKAAKENKKKADAAAAAKGATPNIVKPKEAGTQTATPVKEDTNTTPELKAAGKGQAGVANRRKKK